MEHIWVITIIGSFVAMLVGFFAIVKGFRSELSEKLKEVNENLTATTQLLFKRFDAHKEDNDKKLFYASEINDRKYAQLNICDLTRSSFEKKLDEVSRKLDILLEERRARI